MRKLAKTRSFQLIIQDSNSEADPAFLVAWATQISRSNLEVDGVNVES